MNGSFPRVKDPKKVAAGRKGGKMRTARNREAIQADRKKQTFSLRLRGWTFDQIAGQLGIGHSRAVELYQQAMKEMLGDQSKQAAELRQKQLAKLSIAEDHIFGMIQNRALRIRTTRKDGSVMELADFEALHRLNASLVKNYEQQAKLAGCYKPVQVEAVRPREGLNLAKLVAHLAEMEKREGR